jgi:hypothetical protein
MNPLRLVAILSLIAALTLPLSCGAEQAGAPTPGATPGDQFGPGSSQIPPTPRTTSPGRQEIPEAIPETIPGRPSTAPFAPLEREPEDRAKSDSSQSDFRSTIEQDPRPNGLDR